jgi:hypothetical protein
MSDQQEHFNSEERDYLARFRQQVELGEHAQSLEIIAGCHNKFQFAKTFRTLRKDFARTNQEMRERVARGDAGPGITPAVVEEMIRIGTKSWELKMAALQKHFFLTWGEPIENYAGKGDGSGCAGVVVFFLVLIVAVTLVAVRGA